MFSSISNTFIENLFVSKINRVRLRKHFAIIINFYKLDIAQSITKPTMSLTIEGVSEVPRGDLVDYRYYFNHSFNENAQVY